MDTILEPVASNDSQAEKQPNGNSDTSDTIARSIIKDMSVLVSPPDVCLKVSDMLNDDSASAQAFGEVIMQDPNLSARLLKLANSSYFGMQSKIDTVSRAVAVVGTRELTNMVYALSAIGTFSKISSALTNMNTFWRHSVYSGLVAKALAKDMNILHPERLFIGGLLHDIGTLLINARFPEIAEDTITLANGDEEFLYRAERERLGFDHANLGSLMTESWNLPAALSDAIRWHHEPKEAKIAETEAALIHIGNQLANLSGCGSFAEQVARDELLDEETLALVDLPSNFDQEELLDRVDGQFVETIFLLVA